MRNNFLHCLLLTLIFPLPLLAGGESAKPDAKPEEKPEAKPGAEPLSRYQQMIERSPFALASEAAPPAAPADNNGFTKDLVLTGVVRLNEGAYVTVESKDHNQRFSLRTGASDGEITLVSVAWADGVGKTKATLQRGTEFGTIGFDEAAAAAAPAPNNPGAPPAANAPAPGNAQPQLPPGVVPPKMGQAGQPGSAPQPRVINRIRPIPAAPAQ